MVPNHSVEIPYVTDCARSSLNTIGTNEVHPLPCLFIAKRIFENIRPKSANFLHVVRILCDGIRNVTDSMTSLSYSLPRLIVTQKNIIKCFHIHIILRIRERRKWRNEYILASPMPRWRPLKIQNNYPAYVKKSYESIFETVMSFKNSSL